MDSVTQALSHLGRIKKLRRLRSERSRFSAAAAPRSVPGLQEFIPIVTPEFSAPTHLKPLTELLERATQEPMRFCVSVPPRHGKSETLFHWMAWLLLQEPRLRIAYLGYGTSFARQQVRKAKRIAERAGVVLGDIDREGYFETPAGGSVTGESIQGTLTGLGYHIIIVDDPHKNRQEAESPTVRARVIEGFENDILTREEPAGTSVVVVHTRWHVGDLIGHLKDHRGWPVINLPAINEYGEALAPHLWPLEKLLPHRANEYKWWSLYMGEPRARGMEVFRSPTYCRLADIPNGRAAIGVDLAYTRKTQSDHSISLVLVEGPKNEAGERTYYVADVERHQCPAPEFVQVLLRHKKQWPGARMRWYASGTETGSADFIKLDVRNLEVKAATADKFVRAQPVSEAWNDARIFVPRDAPWSEDFVRVVTSFTGVNDDEDDDVDALAAAFDLLAGPPPRKARFVHVKGI